MDEHPLGKISRQLSELSSVTNISGSITDTSTDHNGQWTQFSGIPTQTGQTPFKNLCPWNSLELQDFNTLSPTLKCNSDSNQSHFIQDSGVLAGCSSLDFLNQNQFDWHHGSSSHLNCQVNSDIAGRLVETSRNKVTTCGFDQPSQSNLKHDNFQASNNVFHYQDLACGYNVPIHQHMSLPSTPSPFTNLDRPSRQSLHSSSSLNLLSNTGAPGNIIGDDLIFVNNGVHDSPSTHGISVNSSSSSHSHILQSPPVFDPSTPPPLFLIDRHIPENFHSMSSSNHFSNLPNNDVINYLQRQENMNLNFDLGTTISKPGHSSFSSQDSPNSSTEGSRMFSKKQWHSFDSNKMPSIENLSSHTSPRIHDFLSERSISVDSSKPSYSDIAKTPRNGPGVGPKLDKTIDNCVRNVIAAKVAKKDEKLSQYSMKKTPSYVWSKGYQSGDADQSNVAPMSRYGLDSFDDQLRASGSHSSSLESLVSVLKNQKDSEKHIMNSIDDLDDVSSDRIDNNMSENYSLAEGQGVSSPVQHQSFMSPNTAKSLSSKQSNSFISPEVKELFFDPRRIFQTKSTNKYASPAQNSACSKPKVASSVGLDDFLPASTCDIVLNNGKPTVSTTSCKLSSNARQHDYINNDLRDTNKLTNQTAAGCSQGTNDSKMDDQHKQKESRVRKNFGAKVYSGNLRNRRKTSDDDKNAEDVNENSSLHQDDHGFLSDIYREKIDEWCHLMWKRLYLWGSIFTKSLLKFFVYFLGIIICLASVTIRLFLLLIGKFWRLIKSKLGTGYFDTQQGATRTSPDHIRRFIGLEENINLPATGDEAMKRLLACKGKDPYSILGLCADSTDDDIKKYYRKQAVLVHPDKNQELGAEEAFKILGHAFEMIGEPAKRKQYDSHNQEANEAEAMREFAEMLSKLQTKIQETANIMNCDNCAGKHRRLPVERPFYSARFCQRCNTRHSAKEGDVWAESTMLGFYWHYFALMEGHVYNITEWMKCHKEYFSHMKANSHAVQYKIATDGNRKNKHHQQGEPNLEDFINRLFKSSASADGQRSTWGASQMGNSNSWAQDGSSAAGASKKNRRKKKR